MLSDQAMRIQRLWEVPVGEYVELEAEGFETSASGVVYDAKSTVVSGMPLGGVDTGCIDIETSGLYGYRTVFNSHVPRGGPLNSAFLGLVVGSRTWVLTTGRTKGYHEPRVAFSEGAGAVPVADVPVAEKLAFSGARLAKDVRYWGHYPVVDMEFQTDAPVAIALRAWSPFVPGDLRVSTMPGAVFDVRVRNESDVAQVAELVFSFDGPSGEEAGPGGSVVAGLGGGLEGACVHCAECEYAVGVVGNDRGVRVGAALRAESWALAGSALPEVGSGEAGLSVAVPLRLGPGEVSRRRFVVSWWAPRWWGEGGPHGGGNRYTHMYSTRWRSASEVVTVLGASGDALLERVLAWQAEIYSTIDLPVWLRSALVNVLHLITEDGLWAVSRDVGGWCNSERGLFGMIECPRGCAQIECIPCSFYGAVALPYFFPELARSTLDGYRQYQYPNGEVPWVFGGVTVASRWGRKNHCEMIYPSPGYQTSLNGVCYVALVDRYWRCSGADDVLAEFYESVKRCVKFTVGLRSSYEKAGRRVLAMPEGDVGTEWFEAPEPGWFGVTNHVGGLRLAMLGITERMARAVGDVEFAHLCRCWRLAGQEVMEGEMWVGSHYRACWDPETGRTADLIFGYQLDGEWLARSHGVDGVFDGDRLRETLQTIWVNNVQLSKFGAVNYAGPDGKAAEVGGYGPYSMFPPEVLMLAMTYMYAGDVSRGEELARRCWENIECRQGLTWDQPNVFRGDRDTGERVFGADYYQNMMLWALPAALRREDLSTAVQDGGLAWRVVSAGKGWQK